MYYIFLVTLIIQQTLGARILAIVPFPFYSHQSFFHPLWQELSLKGHQVTLITTNPIENSSLANLTQIDLSFTYDLVYERNQMQTVMNTESNILILMKHAFFVMQNMTREQLNHREVKKLIESEASFDVLVVEAHVPAWFGLAKKYKCPVVAITSMPATNYMKRFVGNLNNPVFTHSFNLPFEDKLSFVERMISVIFEIVDELQIRLTYSVQRGIIKEALGQDIDLWQILSNLSLLITNEIPGFSKVATRIPSVKEVSGLQIKAPKALPLEIQKFIDASPRGVIYFSLGSMVKSYLISEEQQKVLLEAFSQLPFNVLWKFEEKVKNLPANVRVVKWAPQQDILRHKNVKLFITQGGLQSVDEAIRFRVPILGFPFFGDQFYNAKRIKHLKLGTWLDFNSVTVALLKETILQTVDNETYIRNLDEISDLMAHPLNSLDKAVWWIEYVIRHDGAHHLRSPLADMPFYQYYLFDVILFFLVTFLAASFLALNLLKFICKTFRRTPNKLKKE